MAIWFTDSADQVSFRADPEGFCIIRLRVGADDPLLPPEEIAESIRQWCTKQKHWAVFSIELIPSTIPRHWEITVEYGLVPARPRIELTDRQKLLHTIAEVPNEDTPRLVYADWLEERGEDRDVTHAQWIRTQCEYQQLLKYDHDGDEDWERPCTAECPRCRVEPRLEEVRKRHAQLEKEFTFAADPVRRWDRGFINHWESDCQSCRKLMTLMGEQFMVARITLFDWQGVEASLPENVSETLPFLKYLELPPETRWSQRHDRNREDLIWGFGGKLTSAGRSLHLLLPEVKITTWTPSFGQVIQISREDIIKDDIGLLGNLIHRNLDYRTLQRPR